MSETYMIHVRSEDCTQLTPGYNTNLLVDLKAQINRPENHRFHVSLASAEIPYAWYAFSGDLWTNQIYVDGVPNLVLTPGNYDIWELVTVINADVPFKYTLTYNENTSKVTLTNTDSTTHTLNFSNQYSKGLSKALGFDTSTDRTISAGGSLVADGVVNLQTLLSLFFYCNLSVANVVTTMHGNFEGILDTVPVDAAPYEIIHYGAGGTNTGLFSSEITETVLRSFQISLRDRDGDLLQMNGCKFDLSLLIRTVPDDLLDIITDPSKRRKLDVEPISTIFQQPVENTFRQYAPPPQPQPQPTYAPPVESPPVTQPTAYTPEPVNPNPFIIPAYYPPPATPAIPKISDQSKLGSALLMAKLLDMK